VLEFSAGSDEGDRRRGGGTDDAAARAFGRHLCGRDSSSTKDVAVRASADQRDCGPLELWRALELPRASRIRQLRTCRWRHFDADESHRSRSAYQ